MGTDASKASSLSGARLHWTVSQKHLAALYLREIALREGTDPENVLRAPALSTLLTANSDPVAKGRRVFAWIRERRYPRSGGKPETFDAPLSPAASVGVRGLDSRLRLINPYFYGQGVFDLKEHVLSVPRSCPLDCAYCFLREVFDDPKFKLPPDYARIARELAALRASAPGPIYLNAGENADSLVQDAEFGWISKVWDEVRQHAGVHVEFRSKTDQIKNLKDVRAPNRRLILAFSLNPETDRRVFESNTAPVARRIAAMARARDQGFSIGLRFEPILYGNRLKADYEALLDDVFKVVPPARIHSVSLGCLRLTRGLAKALKRTHPRILAEEWVLGEDKKLRYCRPMRVEIYGTLLELLKERFPQERTVVTTEPAAVWRECGLALKTMPEICASRRSPQQRDIQQVQR